MNRTKRLTLALALTASIGLAACDTDDTDEPDATVGDNTPAATTDGATDAMDDDDATGTDAVTADADDATGTGGVAPPPGDDLTAVALTAVATAEAETGGTAYEIDDQDDDGTWEVDVRVDDRSVEVTVAADGTAVEGTEDDDLDDDDRAALDAATITLAEAVELAVAEVGGVLDDAELEEEDGSFFWEVTLDGTGSGDDVEVEVSVTGEILQTGR